MEDCGHTPEWSGERVKRTNSRGRHTYCAAFKAWIVEQALKPGVSMAGLAMRNQVNANQLRRWVTLHRAGELLPVRMPRLLPVDVRREEPQPTAASPLTQAIEIELGGAVVRVREGVDGAALRIVVEVLRALPR